MSALLQSHPPQQREELEQRPVRSVSLPDRIALRLGLALITWSRRTHRPESRERRANRIEQHLARLDRERTTERELRLLVPIR